MFNFSATQSSADAPDYVVIVSNEEDYHANYHQFADKVNRKLQAGYQLHGGPISINRTLCQAMIKPGKSQPRNESGVYHQGKPLV